MPPYVVGVITWTFVGAFVSLVIAGVLAVLGIWKPKDPATGKWLKGSVIVPVVGAVAGFGGHLFSAGDGTGQQDKPMASNSTETGEPHPDGGQVASAVSGVSSSGAVQAGGANNNSLQAIIPSSDLDPAILGFLSANDLQRPTFPSDWQSEYPGCAVKSRSEALGMLKAKTCFRQLDEFNTQYLVDYQHKYDAYVPQIAQLSFSQPAGPILNFLKSDASGFTTGSIEPARHYLAASEQFDEDHTRLRREAY